MSHLDTFKTANQAGISFLIYVPIVGGQQQMFLTPMQAERFLANPNAVCAEILGMHEADYTEYVASQGTVYCHAKTTKGKSCRNNVPGMSLLTPKEWIKAKGRSGYCVAHGG